MLTLQFSKFVGASCPQQGGWAKAKDFGKAIDKSTQAVLRDCVKKGVRVRHVGRTPWVNLDDFAFAMEHGVAPPAPRRVARQHEKQRGGVGSMTR